MYCQHETNSANRFLFSRRVRILFSLGHYHNSISILLTQSTIITMCLSIYHHPILTYNIDIIHEHEHDFPLWAYHIRYYASFYDELN